MEANTHRVPPKQWKKWSEHARRVFNDLYSVARRNQRLFRHTHATEVPDKHWAVTVWNLCWEAADAVDARALRAGDVVLDINPKRRDKVVREHTVQ